MENNDITNTGVLDSYNMADSNSVISNESTNNVLYNSNEGEIDNLEGGYYYSINGEYLGKEGKSSNVYIAESLVEEIKDDNEKSIGFKTTYINKKLLKINHYNFTYCSGVISNEGSKFEELLFIAHTANNEANYKKISLKEILSSKYSTVPNSKKTPIKDDLITEANSKSEKKLIELHNNARKAIIDVYNGGVDVSNGSQRWDGIDFIAWGLYHAPKKVSNNYRHAKFNQFGTIKIKKDLFEIFKTNCGTSISYESKKWENPKVPGSYVFTIPEEIFLNDTYWIDNEFIFSSNVNKLTLEATAVRGKTIYWRIIN